MTTEKLSSSNLPVLVSGQGGLDRYLLEIRKFPMLTPEEEYMLAKRYADHGDLAAAHRLVTSHLRLVAKIAFGFRGYGLPLGELVSEGNIGLMQAVKKFEPERGFRLATYAIWWIKASIQEYILRSWSLVKIGTSAAHKKLFFNLRKIKSRIEAFNEGDLNPDQVKHIATTLDVSEQDVIDMDRRLSGHDYHLNAPMSQDGEGGEWIDMLEDETPNQEIRLAEAQESKSRRGLLARALATLKPREQEILSARRLQEEPSTLEELSQKYNISRERVRQIEARAMEKLTAEMVGEAA
ncbi:MAG: RNA polymerase sigma factor RpoH [Alphaproteobacteria bacterium]|nr:RNA polymerase sigma factor RpoH [Alphaproteobacteria bacterium]